MKNLKEFEIWMKRQEFSNTYINFLREWVNDDFLNKIDSSVIRTNIKLKEKIKLVSKDNESISKDIIKKQDFLEIFKDIIKSNPLRIYSNKVHKNTSVTKRVVFMHLSDMHFHAMIDSEEMGGLNKYSNVEEARRLAFFVRDVANYKPQYRKDTELVIALNGDELQGIIHDIESTPAITTQVAAGLHLLTQAISYLSTKYKKVKVVCTTGNHERMMHKSNKGRQTRQKWDNYGTIMHIGLQYALKNNTNVEFIIPKSPFAYIDILGHKFFITHSDTVLSMGYPGKSINVERTKNTINQIKEGVGHIDVVVVGHVHVNTKQILNNGVVLITNGSMSGVDEFALSIGITNNSPSQQIFEVTKEYPVGDFRSVMLKGADSEKSLDSIIKPFYGKF